MHPKNLILDIIIPIALILVGLVGNALCFIVFSRRKFKQMSLNFIFRLMAITDELTILSLLLHDLVKSSSHIFCKLLKYSNYFMFPIKGNSFISLELNRLKQFFFQSFLFCKGWFLVYIAFERFLSVQFTSRYKLKIKKTTTQIMTATCIVSFNAVYYISVLLTNDQQQMIINDTNLSNSIRHCCKMESPGKTILKMDMLNNAILPFFLMFAFNILMIRSLFRLRNKIVTAMPSLRFTKDVKFSITVMFFNLIYLCFKLPFVICNYLFLIRLNDPFNSPFEYVNRQIGVNLSLSLYSLTILIYIIFNSLFRHELLIVLKLRKKNKIRFNLEQTSFNRA